MVIKSYNFKFIDSNVLCRKLLQHVELASSSTLGWRSTILSPGLCGGWFKPCDRGILVTLPRSQDLNELLYIPCTSHTTFIMNQLYSSKLLWVFHSKQGFSGCN